MQLPQTRSDAAIWAGQTKTLEVARLRRHCYLPVMDVTKITFARRALASASQPIEQLREHPSEGDQGSSGGIPDGMCAEVADPYDPDECNDRSGDEQNRQHNANNR
jgi:hypothetical protein